MEELADRMSGHKNATAKNDALNTLICPALSLKDVGTDFLPQHKQGAQENNDDDDECS